MLPVFLSAQYRRGRSIPQNYAGATIELGLTTFFGDLDEGAAQGNVGNNLAYKVKANYNIKSVVDLSGRISFGNISGEKNSGKANYLYFKNTFTEFSLDFGINILAPFMKNNRDKFAIYASAGLGLIDFKVKLYDGVNDSIVKTFGYEGQKSTTELVVPIGGRAVYHITPSSAVSLETVLSWVDTDKLDGQTGNDNSDFYNCVSVGYTYKFSFKKTRRGRGGPNRFNRSRSKYRR